MTCIQDLPNEVLLNIFMKGCEDVDDSVIKYIGDLLFELEGWQTRLTGKKMAKAGGTRVAHSYGATRLYSLTVTYVLVNVQQLDYKNASDKEWRTSHLSVCKLNGVSPPEG